MGDWFFTAFYVGLFCLIGFMSYLEHLEKMAGCLK